MLPAILSVNLSQSAQTMSQKGVLVRHLNAIENLVRWMSCVPIRPARSPLVKFVFRAAMIRMGTDRHQSMEAAINAHFETGLTNPLDEAIDNAAQLDPTGIEKVDEIPCRLSAQRLSVVVREKTSFG